MREKVAYSTPFSAVGYGTALPSAPFNGQEFVLVDSTTNPTYQWRFRYNAGSGSAYKWEFIGGTPIIAEVATSETTGSTGSYVALTTAGPSVVLPVAGDYVVEVGARMNGFATSGGAGRMSYDIGGTGAVDGDSVAATNPSGASYGASVAGVRAMKKTGLGAVTLTAKYKAVGANNVTFADRWMRVTPVRVG
jgi:hypothetical protein